MYSVHDENDHKLNVITLAKSDLERKGLYQSKWPSKSTNFIKNLGSKPGIPYKVNGSLHFNMTRCHG